MKQLLIAILLFFSVSSYAQVYQQMSQYGVEFKRMDNDSVLRIPRGLGSLRSISGYDTAQIRYNVSDSSVYVHTGNGWIKVVRATGAGADSAVFATVHKLYTTIDSLGNLIISENLGNTNLTQSDAIRTYDGDGGELSFSNLGKFKVSASDSVVLKVADNELRLFDYGLEIGSPSVLVTGSQSASIEGDNNLVTGDVSVNLGGADNIVSGTGAVNLGGSGNSPRASKSITLGGNNLVSNEETMASIGANNDTTITNTAFVVGNGTDSETRSNALQLLKKGALYLPYYTNTDTNKVLSANASGLLEWRTKGAGGSGGGADSTYQTIEIGTQPNIVGQLLNESFSGVSIPATFTNPSSASVSYNDKLIVASGSGAADNFTKYLQSVSYYNFDKQEFAITLVPKTKKSTSYGVGITFGSNAFYYNLASTSTLNLTDGADSGKVSFNGVSSGNLSFSVGDTIIYSLKVDGWNITVSAWNKATNQRVQISEINSNRLGTGGRMRLCFLGGQQDITKVRVFSWNRKGGIAVLGDSHTSGTNATIEANSYAMRLQYGSKYNYSNFGYPSITTINILSGGNWMNSVWANVRTQDPDYAIIALGYNDATNGDTASFRTAYRAIIDSCIANSIVPILTTLVPRTNNSSPIMTNYNLVISSLATQYSLKLADVFTALSANSGGTNVINPNYLSNDNIHLSDSGHLVMANTIKALGGELFKTFVKDTTSNVTFNDLPTSEHPLSLVGVSNGKLYQMSNKIPTSYIANYGNNNLHAVQSGSVSVSGIIRSRSYLDVSNSSIGLAINFNGGNQYGAGTAGSNISITNGGSPGYGYPAAFTSFTGTQNILMAGRVSKSNTGGTISGSNNTFINSNVTSSLNVQGSGNIYLNSQNTLTTGGGNIGIGGVSGAGITTGSYNTILSNLLDYNGGVQTVTNSTTGAVIIGTPYDYTGSEQPSTGEVVLAGYTRGQRIYNFGAKGGIQSSGVVWRAGYQGGTNITGVDLNIQGTRGTGTGTGGAIVFQTSTAGSTGTSVNTVFNNNLKIEQTGVVIASTTSALTKTTNALLDVQATTTAMGVKFPNYTTTNRDAVTWHATNDKGMTIFNTTTGKLEVWDGTTWNAAW